MSRVSRAYGEIIKEFLKRNNLTFRAAGLGSSISAAYWKDMSDGRVPSEEIVEKISQCFDELDENELRAAAGYSVKLENLDAVKAVEFALRSQKSIPDEGKKQIVDFVQKMQKKYSDQGK